MQNLPFLPFWGYEFCSFGEFQPSKSAKFHKNQNSEPLNVLKWQILHFKNLQIDFTKNLSDRKILKFPHCGLKVAVNGRKPCTKMVRLKLNFFLKVKFIW